MMLCKFTEEAIDRWIHPCELMHDGDVSQYFRVGSSALTCIETALFAVRKLPEEVGHILDLPCGHGRVMRYLRAAFPQAKITGCDLLRDGVDHCAARYNAVPVYSCDDPERIPLAAGFDLIWVGSLFTHLARDLWVRFLNRFEALLNPSGLLVFTTCGRGTLKFLEQSASAFGLGQNHPKLLDQYYRHNFGYVRYPGSDSYYGLSLSTTGWVCDLLRTETGLRVVSYSEKAWDDHQDVFACVRNPEWRPQQPVVHPKRRSIVSHARHFVRRLLRLS